MPLGSTYDTDRCPPWCLLMSFCTNPEMLPLARVCPAKTGAVGSAAVRRCHATEKLFLPKAVLALSVIVAELETAVPKQAHALKPTLSCSLEDPLSSQTIAEEDNDLLMGSSAVSSACASPAGWRNRRISSAELPTVPFSPGVKPVPKAPHSTG